MQGFVLAALPWIALSAPGARADPAEFCVTCTGPDAHYRCTFAGDDGKSVRPGLQLYCISTLATEGKHESCAIGRAAKAPCTGTLKVLALPEGPAGAPAQTARPSSAPAAPADPPPEAVAVPAPSPNGPPSDDVEAKAARNAPVPNAATERTATPAWNEKSGMPSSATGSQGQPANPAPAGTAQTEAEKASPDGLMKPLENAGKAVGEAAKSTGSALSKAGDAVGSAAKKSWKCLTSLFGDC